jgi:lysozyme family protein
MNTLSFSVARKFLMLFFLSGSLTAAAQIKQQQQIQPDTLPGAQYAIALAKTLESEGGYSNKKSNIGGETYCGITRKNYPQWEGWAIIDNHTLKYNEQLPELALLVEAFYKKYFWDEIRGDEIKSQDYANKLFDNAVKRGIERGIRTAQKKAGTKPTGVMDDATIIAINKKYK